MIARQRCRQSLIVSGQPSKPCRPRKGPLHDPTPRQQDEPSLGLVMLDHFQLNACSCRRHGRLAAGISLVDESDFHLLLCGQLNRLGQVANLRPILFVGRSDSQRQQVTQRIHRQVDLRSFALLVPIKSGSATAFRSRLQRSAVQNRRARFGISIQSHAENRPQIMGHGLKASGFEPPLSLLVYRAPRRQIVGHHAPGATGPHKPAQAVEELPQGVIPLRGLFVHKGEVRNTKTPLFVADITRITFSRCRHPQLNAGMYLQCTDFSFKKLITGSRPPTAIPIGWRNSRPRPHAERGNSYFPASTCLPAPTSSSRPHRCNPQSSGCRRDGTSRTAACATSASPASRCRLRVDNSACDPAAPPSRIRAS